MQSDGPYKHYRLCDEASCVKNSCMACVYAEGRKSAENDFKELLGLANRIEEFYPGRYEHVERFNAWKKARGIE